MKNKRFVFYSLLLTINFLMYGMHPLVQKKIDHINEEFNKQSTHLSYDACNVLGLFAWRREEFAKIVFTSRELMTDIQKLNYLQGDAFFAEREKIIRDMIDHKKIALNTIIYQDTNPLREAISLRNVSFIEYLLKNGAKID